MAEKQPFGFQNNNTPPDFDDKLDRVDELVSLMLDEELSEQDLRELERLLEASPHARQEYVGMIHLHMDLMDHYQPEDKPAGTSPVLTGLAGVLSATPPNAQQRAE